MPLRVLASSPLTLGWCPPLMTLVSGSVTTVGCEEETRPSKRVFYQSAFASLRASPESRAFYDRKRREGKRHTQALIALARMRVNVLWAMLRDGTTFETRSAA